jgi:hypothetical protein
MELKAAVKKAATWGTALACGANNGVLILPFGLKKTRGALVDDSLGNYFAKEQSLGETKVEGTLPMYLRYDGIDLLIALAMGATGGAPVQQGATSAYAQKFTLANSPDGLFATLAVHNGVNIDEYTSVKATGFALKGEVGKPLQITFDLAAIDRITNSPVNTTATFAGVTHFETANRVLMSQGVFRMNAQGGAALADGDKIYPGSFELTFKRKMRGVYGAGSSSDRIDEPTNDGEPEVKLKLEFPRYTSTQKGWFEDWDAGSNKKMDIVFTGAQIQSPYNRSFKLSFPNLAIAGAELPIEKGILKAPLEFNCLACDSAPSGMTGVTLPFQADVVNRQSANVLA